MSQKITRTGLGSPGHVRKSRNHGNEGFEGSPISKSKSYKFKLKQNNTMELLSISFYKLSIKLPKTGHESSNLFSCDFPIVFR